MQLKFRQSEIPDHLRKYFKPARKRCGVCFVCHIVEVFREVRRVLRPDGTLWCNMGDSYATSGSRTTGRNDNGQRAEAPESWNCRYEYNRKEIATSKSPGLKPKDLCGIPWRVAFALQADGWWLRSEIIWHKRNPMPESTTDRPTKAHEQVFLLTKSARYFYDAEAVKEGASHQRKGAFRVGGTYTGGNSYNNSNRIPPTDSTTTNEIGGRNLRSVWSIASHSYKGAHFATFPPALVLPCIKAGTSERGCCAECGAPWRRVVERVKSFQSGSGRSGNAINGKQDLSAGSGNSTPDIRKGPVVSTSTTGWEPTCRCNCPETVPCLVLDPFLGSGTTATVAEYLGRDWLGTELNEQYAELARQRIAEGWRPKTERKKRRKRERRQLALFTEGS